MGLSSARAAIDKVAAAYLSSTQKKLVQRAVMQALGSGSAGLDPIRRRATPGSWTAAVVV